MLLRQKPQSNELTEGRSCNEVSKVNVGDATGQQVVDLDICCRGELKEREFRGAYATISATKKSKLRPNDKLCSECLIFKC